MRPALLLAFTTFAGGLAASPALALDNVVVSIKPIHSLVAGVMQGIGEPDLIVTGAASPHTYAMRPSDAAALQDARLVFWVGPGLETFLDEPLSTLSSDARVVTLEETEGLTRLEYRKGGAFEAHEDGDAGHAHGPEAAHEEAHHEHEEGEHDHAGDAEHAHETAAHGEGEHEAHPASGEHAHEGHAHGSYDTHYWLDPENAKIMVAAIADALADTDPENAGTYEANAADLTARLDALQADVAEEVAPVADLPFIVFHDAYHHFENRFGLEAAGAITISPETPPGAARIAELKARIDELGAVCVFSEPQFDPGIVTTLTEGTDADAGVLDPEGAALADGPDLYFQLIRDMATSFTDCLGGEG